MLWEHRQQLRSIDTIKVVRRGHSLAMRRISKMVLTHVVESID